ncbi:4a-hydroxytetrahydrobiopterin dehydratase [Agromyces aureus]|uniref:Putative pterin-4-alpha-carbinolamine dehydratase n=1 Tax=Agromyces aureus TaxID=453304 RepID=A0A191WGT1_9MICO|nr:4a-hydroxytetrahydrobiopterin dehydratase [Agromyces aureus]ANJ27466.1 hypothetical protein ATC03_12860 [Agromyces aureus]
MDPQRILTPAETADALGGTAFAHVGERLEGAYVTADFASAVRLLDAVAVAADELDHHPDVTVGWGAIAFDLSSHDAGGVTSRDLALVGLIQAIADAQGARPRG